MSSQRVSFAAKDGWSLGGELWLAEEGASSGPGVVLVHASKHERDAYGLGLPEALVERGIAAIAFDIRGRGESRGPISYAEMAPLQRRQAAHDVESAAALLSEQAAVEERRIGVVAEQDAAAWALSSSWSEGPPLAYTLISGRLGARGRAVLDGLSAPLLCLVSKEDDKALGDMALAYASSHDARSDLWVFEGLGFGTTMFSAWEFSRPESPTLERKIADWLAAVL